MHNVFGGRSFPFSGCALQRKWLRIENDDDDDDDDMKQIGLLYKRD